jgi:hypothetical protein
MMNWLKECDIAAEKLSAEKKQEFLDQIWEGKTLGDAREICGISFDAANGIIRANIQHNEYLTLRRSIA